MKTVLITGASRGLGHCLAEEYLVLGDRVFACARNVDSAKLKALKEKGGERVELIPMDVANTASVERAADLVARRTERLDLIINNAAIHADDPMAPLEKLNVDSCLEPYNVNALGPLRVAKAFLPLLEKGEEKELVNISTESASIADCRRVKEFDYCMSKAALNMESRLLQNALSERGIRVLAVHPGWVRTDMGGPGATFAPEEAAHNIRTVAERALKAPNGPVFVDYEGNPMNY